MLFRSFQACCNNERTGHIYEDYPMKKKIAVFATGWACEILSQFLEGLTDRLKSTETDVFLFTCYPTYTDKPERRQGQFNIFRLPDLKQFDGIVLFASTLSYTDDLTDFMQKCRELDIPVISQGMQQKGMYYIGSDNYSGSRTLCEHLINEHNVRSMVFFAGDTGSLDSYTRLKAVQDVLAERNLESVLEDVYYTNWENGVVDKYIRQKYDAGNEPPEAIICANDGLAMQACLTLSSIGYNVPDDIIVTGFDHINDSQMFYPSIASVDQGFYKMGEECGQLWLDLSSGVSRDNETTVPSEFIPGESCGCQECRESDNIRRIAGREAVNRRSMSNYFARKLNDIDETILSSVSYDEFRTGVKKLYLDNHVFEGSSFHLILDSRFGPSIYDTNIPLTKKGYSRQMDVVFSMEDEVIYKRETFNSREMIPGYWPEKNNHLYVFVPLHSGHDTYGYLVFRDCMESVSNHFLETYQSRLIMALEKLRHTLSLNVLNEKLLTLMRKDPLTSVNNRMAYEDKIKQLQSEINMNPDFLFGIVTFDVNDLKNINDKLGHDAGDIYLIRCCRFICNTFKHSPVYRIGGDEFVAILTGDDYERKDALIKQMRDHMRSTADMDHSSPEYISIASGLSVFDRGKDRSVSDIVKRADKAMYDNKAEMKGSGN